MYGEYYGLPYGGEGQEESNPTRLRQIVDIVVGGFDNASVGANTYRSISSFLLAKLDVSKFDGATYYFEASLTSSVAGTAYCELYNVTDGASVSGSEVSTTSTGGTNVRVRSSAISLAGDKVYTIRIKSSTATSGAARVSAARIVVIQDNPTLTQSHFELGREGAVSSTSTSNVISRSMEFLYEAAKYDGVVDIVVEGYNAATSGNTGYIALYDVTAAAVVSGSVSSTTSTTPTITTSSAVTLIDGHVYRPIRYVSAGGGVWAENVKVIITMSGFTKLVTMAKVWNLGPANTTNTSYELDTNGLLEVDPDDYLGATNTVHNYTVRQYSNNALGTSTNALYSTDLAAVITDSQTSGVTGVTEVQQTSPDFFVTDVTEVMIAIKSSSGSYQANISNSGLLTEVSYSSEATLAVDDMTFGLAFETPTLVENRTLVVADMAFGLSFESPTLTENYTLTVSDMAFSLAFESPTLVYDTALTVADMAFGLAFEAPTLVYHSALVVNDMLFSLAFDSFAIGYDGSLGINDLQFNLAFDNVSLVYNTTLTVQDMQFNLAFENASVLPNTDLVVADMLFGVVFESPTLSENRTLTVADMLFGLAFETPVLSQGATLTVQDMTFAFLMDSPTLTQEHILAMNDMLFNLIFEDATVGLGVWLIMQDISIGLTFDNVELVDNRPKSRARGLTGSPSRTRVSGSTNRFRISGSD